MNWLKKFMVGRYGTDKLGIALLISSVIFSLIGSIVDLQVLIFISYIPLIWCIFRIFSKNIHARVNENNKFLNLYTPLKYSIKEKIKLIFGTKTHKYYRCKKCGQIIRIPRGKGKIEVTCPKCKHRFITKS